jgi:hypothetical protein
MESFMLKKKRRKRKRLSYTALPTQDEHQYDRLGAGGSAALTTWASTSITAWARVVLQPSPRGRAPV